MTTLPILYHQRLWIVGFAAAFIIPSCHSFVSIKPNLGVSVRPQTLQQQSRPAAVVAPVRTPPTVVPLKLAPFPPELVNLANSVFSYSGNVPFWQAFSLNAVLFTLLSQKLLKSLTPEGFAHSMALGTMLWMTLGWRGWTLCVLYLAFGNIVTKVRFEDKEKRGLAEGRGGRRGPENVWGSAFTGLVCAACSVQGPTFLGISSELYVLGFVASFATKLADTFASEIGKAYGKTTFLITTLQPAKPGTEGAVSLEGTAAAVLGGLLLSLYGYAVQLIPNWSTVAISTIAAFLATNAESVLGATMQGKKGLEWMTNEVVNGLNTMLGAAFAVAGGIILLGL